MKKERWEYPDGSGEDITTKKGDRITLEELEQRAKRAVDDTKEALVALGEYLEDTLKDEAAMDLLESFSEKAHNAILAEVDYNSYKSHARTIDFLLTDPKLKMQRRLIGKHKGEMHWVYFEGNEVPLPIMFTSLEHIGPPDKAAIKAQNEAAQIIKDLGGMDDK